jgi:hypothetical protein
MMISSPASSLGKNIHPIPLTWNPAGASPALAAGPATFTADAISVTNYIRTTNVNNLTTLKQTFSGVRVGNKPGRNIHLLGRLASGAVVSDSQSL